MIKQLILFIKKIFEGPISLVFSDLWDIQTLSCSFKSFANNFQEIQTPLS